MEIAFGILLAVTLIGWMLQGAAWLVRRKRTISITLSSGRTVRLGNVTRQEANIVAAHLDGQL